MLIGVRRILRLIINKNTLSSNYIYIFLYKLYLVFLPEMSDTLRYDTYDTNDTYRSRFSGVSYRIVSRIISYRVCIKLYRIVSYRVCIVFASCRIISYRAYRIVSYRRSGVSYRIVSLITIRYDTILISDYYIYSFST